MKNVLDKLYYHKFKILFIVWLILIIILVGFIFMIRFTNREDIILVNDLSCEFREEIYVKDFIKDIRGTVLDNYRIDTNEVGERQVTLVYENRYGFKVYKKFVIEVKDVIAPTVVVSNPYTVEIGSIDNLMDTIFCADDYDDDVKCNIVGEYDLEKQGKYDLKVVATDKSDNITMREFTLNVIEKKKETSSNKENTEEEYTSFKEVYKKYKTDSTLIGLDLSKWQGDVDFGKLKEQGVSFVMLKVGGQQKIGGDFIIDPKFYHNIEKAKEYDIDVGVYFYSYAKTVQEAKKQARWIISEVKDYDIELPIVFDWENWTKYTSFHISFHTLNKVANAFMEEVEKNGYEAMLYSSKYYLETIWYRENYTNWLAYYTDNNNYQGDYLMWQLCSDGKIDGIDGYVDIDVMYLT